MKRWMPGVLLAVAVAFPCAAVTVDVAPYAKRDDFETIKLSPNGDYYAATVPMEGKSVLLVVHRSDNKASAGFSLGKNTYVAHFDWVSPKRLVISMGRKFGALDQPELTGNLYAINADGSDSQLLVGPDVAQMSTGTHIQGRTTERVAAFLVDDLPGDDQNVLVSVSPFDADAFSRVDRLDVVTGRRMPVVTAPVRNARFMTDHHGVVRFVIGVDMSDVQRLYYRAADKADWVEINNELSSGHAEWPLGFSADDRTAYIQVEQSSGPDAIVAMDVATNARRQVLRDDEADPAAIIHGLNNVPVGAMVMGNKTHTLFFDPGSPDARLYRSLEAAFPGNTVAITSRTTDGHQVMVSVSSDRNPGDFYLFDTVAKKADHLVSRRDWFDPEAMASVQPFNFKARDGMTLYGYVTTPRGAGKNLPMVVLPHGGPFGISDEWAFDPEIQMLASAGYAVLQVNFRGSGEHGRAYQHAGMRQWGRTMQDDVTDATRWAISQGIADGRRICIYGASYGGYAALMGSAKEPGLYRCAVGYVGVYDVPAWISKGGWANSSKAYLDNWVGKPSDLVSVSPVRLASQIKVPVLLVAGGQDERVPIEQSEAMEKALRAAGVPVETLFIRTEGHGFFVEDHKKQFYNQLLGFLDKNIGPAATASAGASTAATQH
ncbi:alpha/beta hydrolase family protein [Cognatiluteimonas profundi]|uniref:alpha/beta hydrolase family protein n=1 Tax=Cognatiluteimonas profundi TaxID=2594501 RepID=UPI00131BBF60|nr:S9 family peptidase [Lysobacter profundi]